VPTIKVTHEDDLNGHTVPEIKVSEHGDGETEDHKDDEEKSGFAGEAEGLEKPGPVESAEEGGASPNVDETLSFSTKRLCERWLDNLFMVLYEVGSVCFRSSL
jgi:Chs5-Arf1p-binding protein BUD7/BCH1